MARAPRTAQLSPKELNLKLADLEDQGLLAFKDVILDPQCQLVGELVSVMQWTTVEEEGLVDLLVHFFRVHGKEEALLLWAIRTEIATTAKAPELFRMQSFATQLLFKYFFDDASGGKRYLQRTVSRVIDAICEVKEEQLELVPNGLSVSVHEADENLNFVLDIANDFFAILRAEVDACPPVIRTGFATMRSAAKSKFPAVVDSIVPVCFFLRFLSPTLVQPELFGLTKGKPEPHVFKALLIISKLLQNIANGIVKNNITSYAPHDEVILSFIQKHIVTVREIADALASTPKLSDETDVFKPRTYSDDDRELALDKLHIFLLQGQYREMLDQRENEAASNAAQQAKRLTSADDFVRTLKKHLNDLEWKKLKEKHGATLFGLRKVRVSLDQAKSVLHNLDFREWMQDVFGEKIVQWEKCMLVDRLEGMKELWTIKFKFPFPYGTRTATVERVFHQIAPNEYAMLLMPYRPEKKTNTNATFDCAYFFREDREKTSVDMNFFCALNPDGVFPPALNAPMGKPFLGGMYALKELFMSGGKTNTRRTRRVQQSSRPEAEVQAANEKLEKSVEKRHGSPVRSRSPGGNSRKRSTSDSGMSSSHDGSPDKDAPSLSEQGRSTSLRRLKSLSKRSTTRNLIGDNKDVLTPILSQRALSARGFMPVSADEEFSDEYDLLSDSEDENGQKALEKAMKLKMRRMELRRGQVTPIYDRSRGDSFNESVSEVPGLSLDEDEDFAHSE